MCTFDREQETSSGLVREVENLAQMFPPLNSSVMCCPDPSLQKGNLIFLGAGGAMAEGSLLSSLFVVDLN